MKYLIILLAWMLAFPAGSENIAPKLIVHTASGEVTFDATFARTDEDRMKGLMFVQDFPDNAAMIFVYPESTPISMWMKNTYIPLDIMFVDEAQTISQIHANAIPHDLTPIHSNGDVTHVIELLGGAAEKYGIAEGNALTFIFEE